MNLGKQKSVIAGCAFVVLSIFFFSASVAFTEDSAPIMVDQTKSWTSKKRALFYSLDQGSRIIPLRWIKALKLPDGKDFMYDGLRRYGYLPDKASPDGLPVGFTTAGAKGKEMLGMTCAACHTRQIEYGGKSYRIDGGPALNDFQAFANDLDIAVRRVLDDPDAYDNFVRAVIGDQSDSAEEDSLRWSISYWYQRHHTLMDGSLPRRVPWGLGRVDAVGMIFNRLTGLDLGPLPHHIIESNIRSADAPVRYPFLWNANRQEFVQWTGFARNTKHSTRLARNIGQVLGVYGEFLPRKTTDEKGNVEFDLFAINSVNFSNLETLENLMSDIGAPRWPWTIDDTLLAKGKKIYKEQCDGCHRAEPTGEFWQTPIRDVRTDSRAVKQLARKAMTGILADAGLGGEAPAPAILGLMTFGLARQWEERAKKTLKIVSGPPHSKAIEANTKLIRSAIAVETQESQAKKQSPGYAARVLHGIWAAAPYLHNGSVPTLADLLKPAAERPQSFEVGLVYDLENVGLAREQPGLSFRMITTGCEDPNSGNSRCGHEYGTKLPDCDKRALLEYLKQL